MRTFTGNRIGDDGILALSRALMVNTTLECLSLSGLQLSNNNTKCFIACLHKTDNMIGRAGVNELCRALGRNTTLKELIICGTSKK